MEFTLHSDEPIGLLGTDTAVSPSEYILKGLAGCYMVTLASLAAARDIELEASRLTLSFDIVLSGFLGIDKTVCKGAQQITVNIEVDSLGTSREALVDLFQGTRGCLAHTGTPWPAR